MCHVAHYGRAYACSSKRLKEDVNDGSLRGLLASHGVVAYLCGHLHGLFGQRQHLLHLGVGSGDMLFDCHCLRSDSRQRRHHVLATSGSSTVWHPVFLLCSALHDCTRLPACTQCRQALLSAMWYHLYGAGTA